MHAATASAAARGMVLAAAAVEAYEALTAAGVGCRVLKGPVLEQLLYHPGDVRVYADVDLLVDPARWHRALSVLQRLGYGPALPGHRVVEQSRHAWSLVRPGPTPVAVDLHHRLHGTTVSSRRVWAVASRDALRVLLAGRTIETTSAAVTCFHAAVATLPAYGGGPRQQDEYQRLQARLDCPAAMVAAVAAALGGFTPYEDALTGRPGTHPPMDNTLWHLHFAPTWRARARVLTELLAPPPAYVRREHPGVSGWAWRQRLERRRRRGPR